MTFGRESQPLVAELAAAIVRDLAVEGPVRGTLMRSGAPLGSPDRGEPTGGSVLLSGDAESWQMTVDGFRWGLQPRLIATADELRVEVLSAGEPRPPRDDAESQDLAALGVLWLLDPRTVVGRAIERQVSGTFELGQLACFVDLRDLRVPGAFLDWIGASAAVRLVQITFEGGRPVEMRQQDLPPYQGNVIVETLSAERG